MVSYYTVEKQSFKDLITTFDSQYELPGRSYFSNTAIPRAYNRVRGELQQAVSAVDYFSLTTDMWSSTKMTPYMSLTFHFIDTEWTLVSKCLQTSFLPEDHTDANLADALQEVLHDWGLKEDNVSCVTTDSGSNIKAAVRNLGWPWLSCFGHNLNLAVSNTFEKTEKARTDRALAVCRTINGFFSHSWKRRRELKKAQVQLGLPEHSLVTDCATRWGSKQKMIDRMLEQRTAINRVLADDRKVNVSITWQDEDVAIVEQSVKAKDTLAPSDEDGHLTANLKAGIMSILDDKYKALPEASLQLIRKTTFLDPRYRGDYDPNVEETKKMIEEEAFILGRKAQSTHPVREEGEQNEEADVEPQPKRKKTLASLLKRKAGTASVNLTIPEKVVTEIATYAQESPIHAEQDPLAWWKENQSRFPLLAKIAKKYLCVCATSCASERVFSTMGNIVTPKRSHLKPEMVNMLGFLTKNM
ncbi:E3 SUMO-protein ligase ZBED1 [Siphateles boraxobius]|uniref:E3 SUMO-protein ligase ZBED1 n=1 Tax=Siphateles boraxobius TaxID=180520 RepID=UPI0040647BB7